MFLAARCRWCNDGPVPGAQVQQAAGVGVLAGEAQRGRDQAVLLEGHAIECWVEKGVLTGKWDHLRYGGMMLRSGEIPADS